MTLGSRRTTGSVKQTIVAHVEAPRLNGVSVKDFSKFQRLRELYEKQVAEKNREPGVSITPTSLKASIDDADLRIFVTAKWVTAEDISSITEEQLRECITKKCTRDIGGEQLHLIEDAVKNVSMKMDIDESEDRVWTLHRDYTSALENTGFSDIPQSKPHIAISHILKRVKPKALKSRIKNIVLWRKDIQFDRKDFGAFMRELALQAKKLESEQAGSVRTNHEVDNSDCSSDETAGRRTFSGKVRKPGNYNSRKNLRSSPQQKEKESNNIVTLGKRRRQSDELPPCLNQMCRKKGGRHFINNCTRTSVEEAKRLRTEYRASKNQKSRISNNPGSGKVFRLGSEKVNGHSALFHASFENGSVEAVVLTDQGSDTNLISKTLLNKLQEAGARLSVSNLTSPHIYSGVGGNGKVTCKQSLKADVLLKIRHATSLLLRNVEWRVGDHNDDHAIIGRPLLESIGCDNRALLAASCDRFGGVIDVDVVLKDEISGGNSISILSYEGTYHSGGGQENDGLNGDDVYIDIGEDSEQDIRSVLNEKVEEAKDAGMSAEGVKELRQLLSNNASVF